MPLHGCRWLRSTPPWRSTRAPSLVIGLAPPAGTGGPCVGCTRARRALAGEPLIGCRDSPRGGAGRATNGWVAANDVSRFSAHATQHVLLGLVVPLASSSPRR